MQVCLATTHLLWNTTLGGHAWVFLNWALGLQAAGARIVLYEKVRWVDQPARLIAHLRQFRAGMGQLGLDVAITLLQTAEEAAQLAEVTQLDDLTLPLEQVVEESALLLNFKYSVPQQVVDRFRRSALVDIDPGLLQNWIAAGHVRPAVHDINFTIGETVGQPGARIPDCGMRWVYTPPPVHLPAWPVAAAPDAAPFTTVTNWWGEYEVIDGRSINNEKRTNFLAYIDLPSLTRARLELAIYHEPGSPSEMPMLTRRGWAARAAAEVSASPQDYRAYLQGSRGEFSCAKQSCMEFANGWISDRTICYLASGKPAVVQYTGPSRFLPDRAGLLRFGSLLEAARFLDRLEDASTYAEHCQAARALVERHFDAEQVMRDLLATAIAVAPGRRDRASR
jgi:hypothetical protein